jgi:sugar-specific transcriptional regulator TrmB
MRCVRIQKESIRALTDLGLATGQAKVYLALAILEKATAKEIANQSNIARQEVYRLLTELQKKSLIERIIASPTQFKAIPLEEGLLILVRRKEKEVSKIKNNIFTILNNFTQNNAKTDTDKDASQFAYIPGKEAFILKLKKIVENVEETIDISSENKGYLQSVFLLSENIEKNLRKGIRYRVIVDDSEDIKSLKKAVQEFTKMPSYKIKALMGPKIQFAIFDEREVIVACVSGLDFAESPTLWSNNPNLIAIVQNHFESMWKKATPLN